MMRSLFVLAALAAGLAPPFWSPAERVATGAAPAPQKKDQDLIQGSWQVVKREVQDKVHRGPFRDVTWVFSGDQITMLDSAKKEWAKYTFVLNPDKKPTTIKMMKSDGQGAKTIFGIYRIAGDTLTLTQSLDDFPKGFGGPGKKTGLLTFKRIKP